jgi:hypothetical protein
LIVSPGLITAQPVGFAEHSAGTGLAGVHAAIIMLATINIDKKTKIFLAISPPKF